MTERIEIPEIVEIDEGFPFAEFASHALVERIRQFDTALRTLELPDQDRAAMDRETKHMVFEYWCRKERGGSMPDGVLPGPEPR